MGVAIFGWCGIREKVGDPWANLSTYKLGIEVEIELVNLTCEWVETFEDVLHVLNLAATSYYSYLRVNSQYH